MTIVSASSACAAGTSARAAKAANSGAARRFMGVLACGAESRRDHTERRRGGKAAKAIVRGRVFRHVHGTTGSRHMNISPEKAFAFDTVERNAKALATLADSIFYFGEVGMQEHETSKLM